MANKAKESNKKIWIARVVLAVVLIAALLISLLWTDAINRKLGLVKTVESAYDGNSTDEVLSPGEVGENLNVHFVDVGQGDACIVELPDNKKLLIDAGDTHKENKDKLLSYIEEHINDAEGNDIRYFDYVILTHPDSDHCGGMGDILSKYPAKTFYRPNVYSSYAKGDFSDPAKPTVQASVSAELEKYNSKDTLAYYNAIRAGYNPDKVNGIESTVVITDATDGQTDVIEPEGVEPNDPNYYSLTFYGPTEKSFKDWNDYSPIMILEYHEKRFMLSGDAEKEAEADFVSLAKEGKGKYEIFDDDFTVDVFKLGHHGSGTSSSEDFIETMTTAQNRQNVIAVISCGEGNKYKHPHTEVLERLSAMGFAENNVVRTDTNGTVAMSVRGVEENGTVRYELFMGAEAVRRTDSVPLTWSRIVLIAVGVVLLVLIILPAVRDVRKSMKRASKGTRRR